MADGDRAEPTIYDVARAAGVASSTVSRALSKPGRVSFRTAEHVRRVADELGYRSSRMELPLSTRGTGVLALIVADIANPVFVGMIRGAEREASQHGLTLAIVETQESQDGEERAIARLEATVDGFILASSRLPDQVIRALAKRKSVVVLNRTVGEVPSVISDNVRAIKKATEHLIALRPRLHLLPGRPGGFVRQRDALAGAEGGRARARSAGPPDRTVPPDDPRGRGRRRSVALAADHGRDRIQRPDGDRFPADGDRRPAGGCRRT